MIIIRDSYNLFACIQLCIQSVSEHKSSQLVLPAMASKEDGKAGQPVKESEFQTTGKCNKQL